MISNKTDRILLTGASGLLGSYCLPLLKTEYKDVFVTHHKEVPEADRERIITVDLTDSKNFLLQLERLRPDIIINLAAFTDVDECERNKDLALAMNRDVVNTIVSYIKNEPKCFLLHMSTDYVFDGASGNYSESCNTNPINWYGSTKLGGEMEIIDTLTGNDKWCIVRTSTPFGLHHTKKSFPMFVIEELSNRKSIRVLEDQYTSPTYCLELCGTLLEILQKEMGGLIHVAGKSKPSRYEQAIKIAEVFELDRHLVIPASMNEMNWIAKRPHNSTLNVGLASSILKSTPSDFDSSLRSFYAALVNDRSRHFTGPTPSNL
jgi:dTDP-4-dehydrorhamnose reductase